jgi:hypothetical protein
MSRSYPIWVAVTSCIYKGGKSFGVKNHSTMNVKVGTSASDSYDFVKIELVHIQDSDDNKKKTFQLLIDNVLVKEGRIEQTDYFITKKLKQG